MKTTIKRSIVIIIVLFLTNFMYGAHITVAPATCYMDGNLAPYNTLNGGDTLFMTAGNKAYIYLKNFIGSSAAPIVVINQGGVVTDRNKLHLRGKNKRVQVRKIYWHWHQLNVWI